MCSRNDLTKTILIFLLVIPLLTTASSFVVGDFTASRFTSPEIAVLGSTSAELVLPPHIGLNADTSDFDGDGVHDHDELLFAQWYIPRLIFDEDESQDLINTMLPLFQVTPTWVKGPNSNERYIKQIVITYVFLYRKDKGADINGCGGIVSGLWDALDLFALYPQITKKDINEIKTGHCGDTETFRVYLNYSLQNRNWTPVNVKINRHGGSFGPYSWSSLGVTKIAAGKSGCQAAFGSCFHPTIYVSQNKHAMYTALTGKDVGCETVGSKKITKWGIGCTISWEDCDSDHADDKVIPSILDAQNVGETGHYRYSKVSSTNVKNSGNYNNEWIWPDSNSSNTRDDVFCGGYTYDSCNSNCAGSLPGKWEKFDFAGFGKISGYRSVM